MSQRIALRCLGDETQQVKLWKRFLCSKNEKIALQATIYLNDRAYGKPVQPLEGTGKTGNPLVLKVELVKPSAD